MAKIAQQPKVELEVTLVLTESEARALDALAGYGDDAFITAFYREMGRAYLEPHEKGLRLLLKTARGILPGILGRTDAARKAFDPPPKRAVEPADFRAPAEENEAARLARELSGK